MSLFRKITEYGVSNTDSNSERRNILLTNYISLIAAAATILLFIGRLSLAQINFSITIALLEGCVLFLIPVLLNRLGLINLSRLVLCWVPAIHQVYAALASMREVTVHETSNYIGLRFFILAFSCFPFLVFDVRKKWLFIAGLLGPLLSILLYDPVLYFFGYGYTQVGLSEDAYEFNNVRIFVSFLVIGSSSYLLKRHVEKSERMNDTLLIELAEKNKLIKKQANDEVHQLNEQLYANLQQLSEREFLLNQSQKLAKIGSWEYHLADGYIFWSDEMFNIFGLDKNIDLRTNNLAEIMWGEESEVLLDANTELLRHGTPYDLTLRARTPFGYKKWVRVNAFPILENKNVTGIRAICHDITFYREAEEQLRTSALKFTKVFQQNPDLMTIVREDNMIIYDVNEKASSVMGYAREELIGQVSTRFDFFVRDEDRKLFFNNYFTHGRADIECAWKRKNGEIIYVLIASRQMELDGVKYFTSVIKDISDRKVAEEQKEIALYSLNERVKELTTLYKTSQILLQEKKSILAVLQELVDILPAGWQYPEITAARITIGNWQVITPNFKAGVSRQIKEFKAHGNSDGILEIVYLEQKKQEAEGPFLAEERNLINLIAEMLRAYLAHKHEAEELNKSQANLNATINNTEVLIWSVDKKFRLVTFNQPFYKFIKDQYQIEIQTGFRVLNGVASPEGDLTEKWAQYYQRALTGEIITLEESRFGIDFQYSLSPIVERDQIIGVSIFADNVTERKTRDRELADANRKIGELKLMALRSVMSPHFIFNVLNSIQYFIAKNDRLNAINYLSTFSKLIRSILTHSVNNKIKLSEEIEMLRNYVHLEMTRFENKFDFIFTVDEGVDVDSTEIPSLLIQPYVENAILHGLYNKKEKGILSVRVSEKDETVIFEIEDNGIGREAALKLRKQNFPAHKSMGIKLTEERLKLVNLQHQAAFEIEDLFDSKGPSGTRVKIRVSV